MKTILKQLLFMNLALLLAILFVLPAAASELEEYTLTLYSNSPGNDTSLTLTGGYPTEYTLSEYLFKRDSYVQVAWSDAVDGDAKYRLNALYVPATSTDLYAFWLEAGEGEIILNSLSGDLDEQGTFYKKFSTSVMLPDELIYAENDDELLAWSTEVNAAPDEQGVYSGLWYSGGDEIIPEAGKTLELYGHTKGDGSYVIYHPTEGAISKGGMILVQSASESNSLMPSILDESSLTTPEGYQLAGWALEPSGQVFYIPGDAPTLQVGDVVHLYAQWTKINTAITPEDGVCIETEEDSDLVTIMLSSEWCAKAEVEKVICALYDEYGKLLVSGSGSRQADGSIKVDLEYGNHEGLKCKIFAMDDGWVPVRGEVTCTLPVYQELS